MVPGRGGCSGDPDRHRQRAGADERQPGGYVFGRAPPAGLSRPRRRHPGSAPDDRAERRLRGSGVLSIRRANAPYFVNPIPKKRQLQVVAVCLALIAVVSMLLPAVSISFYKPGKTQVQSTRSHRLDFLKL